MGVKNTKRIRILSESEITSSIPTEHLKRFEELSTKYKDQHGFINELNLTKLLDGILAEEIVNLIYTSIPEQPNKFTVQDINYLFALLISDSEIIRKAFLSLLIFNHKEGVKYQEYVNIVNFLFKNKQNILKYLTSQEILAGIKKGDLVLNENFNKQINSIIKEIDFSKGVSSVKKFIISKQSKEEIAKKAILSPEKENNKDNDHDLAKDRKIDKTQLSLDNKNVQAIEKEKDSDNINLDTHQHLIRYNNNNYSDVVVSLISTLKGDNSNSTSNSKDKKAKLDSIFAFHCECFLNSLNSNKNQISTDLVKKKSFFNNNTSKNRKTSVDEKISAFHSDLNKMNPKFISYEKENNGAFPLKLFDNMLSEIGVNNKIINIIISYLKLKTQKSFLMFEQFKWIMEKFSSEDSEALVNFLFRLLSNDKTELNTKDLVYFLKTYSKLPSKDIQKLLENYNLNQFNVISIEAFTLLFKENEYSILDNLERIKYIPFIFFEIPCDSPIKQKNCIKLLFGDLQLKDYIFSQIRLDRKFYLVDKEFWDTWCEYVDFNDNSLNEKAAQIENNNNNTKPDNDKLKVKVGVSSHTKQTTSMRIKRKKEPKINLDNISKGPNCLKYNAQYLRDFIVLTEEIYNLFLTWYSSDSGNDLCRTVIQTNKSNLLNDKLALDAAYTKNQVKDESTSIVKKYLEIEVFPIYISFMKIDYMNSIIESQLNELNLKSLSEKEYIKLVIKTLTAKKEAGNFKAVAYSRVMSFKKILQKFEDNGQLKKNSRLWLLSENKFYLPQDNSCFEEENSEENVVIVFDQQINGRWEKEVEYENLIKKYFKTEIKNDKGELNKEEQERKKKLQEEENNIVMVGMRNLGNSK